MDLISVIVPVYNVENLIERCVKSIIAQTYSNIEIILVDDGSSDSSGLICDKLALSDSRIVVIHKKNSGASAARNVGLDKAKGQYIGFVDSDDYIEPQMYESLLLGLKKYDTDISCTGIIREYLDGRNKHIIRCPSEITVFYSEEIIREILLARYVGSSLCTKLYKRACWENKRLSEGEINEDVKIIFDLYYGKTMVHIANAMYHYISNPKGVTHTLSEKELMVALKNATYFLDMAKSQYPNLMYDAIYYLTDTAKVILMQNEISHESELYKCSKDIFSKHWRVLGWDYRSILLRSHLYHFCKKIMRGK